MQIGVISDIHGNLPALRACLEELRRLNVDEILCLGDATDPLPDSEPVFRFLNDLNIPILRGNHEDYLVKAANNPLDPTIAEAKFKPVQICAASFSSAQIRALEELPFSTTRQNPQAGEIYFCHASPSSNFQGWRTAAVDSHLEPDLDKITAAILVAGHWHIPAAHAWRQKTLLTAGSVGIPLTGNPQPEFLVLESKADRWQSTHLQISYAFDETLRRYADSGWLEKGAPISLLYFLEIATGRRALSTFFPWATCQGLTLLTDKDWKDAVRHYLRQTGRWDELTQLLCDYSTTSLEKLLGVS